eukprot:12577154-Alexandrium_andersonii.AAC.1
MPCLRMRAAALRSRPCPHSPQRRSAGARRTRSTPRVGRSPSLGRCARSCASRRSTSASGWAPGAALQAARGHAL